jgi:hypothetical protein
MATSTTCVFAVLLKFDVDLMPHWPHIPIDILKGMKIIEIAHSLRPETAC